MTEEEFNAESPRLVKTLALHARGKLGTVQGIPDIEGELEHLAEDIRYEIVMKPKTYLTRKKGEVYRFALNALTWRIERFRKDWMNELSWRGPSRDSGSLGNEGDGFRSLPGEIGPSADSAEDDTDLLEADWRVDFDNALTRMTKQPWYDEDDREIAYAYVMLEMTWREIEEKYDIPHSSAHRKWVQHIGPYLREALADYFEDHEIASWKQQLSA